MLSGRKDLSWISATTFYREQFHGISVIRVPQFVDHSQSAVRRILYYITFACSAVLLGLGRVRKAEIMLVYQSAIPTGIAAWVISRIRGMPYILDVVDLWPESVVAERNAEEQAGAGDH